MEYISRIIGKNLEAVEKILGHVDKKQIVKPSGTSCKENGCIKAYFQNQSIEIIFIDRVADWITIHNTNKETINKFISFFRLTEIKPSFFNAELVARYYNLDGLKEISFFNDGKGDISYAYIKAFTD